jgi:uncharacterized protein
MPTVRDLVAALRQREAVEAAIVLGRDGLVIDGQAAPGVSAEGVAALVPSVLSAAEEMGAHGGRGALQTAILEYADGIVIASILSDDAILIVIARPSADVGRLLFELRRNRARIATLI